jgi:hypothetical protein
MATSLPLTVRKDIRDAEPKRDAHLASLKSSTGLAFTAVSTKRNMLQPLRSYSKRNNRKPTLLASSPVLTAMARILLVL